MDPSSLLLRVRINLADAPISHLQDPQILVDIRKAKKFVDLIKLSTALEDDVITGIEYLATYYAFMTWTVLAVKEYGATPYDVAPRAIQLRIDARAFLQLISKYPLNEDLTIDISKIKGRPNSVRLTTSVISGSYVYQS